MAAAEALEPWKRSKVRARVQRPLCALASSNVLYGDVCVAAVIDQRQRRIHSRALNLRKEIVRQS